MARTILIYAVALAAGVFVLEWLEYRHVTRAFSTEFYIALLAVGFIALGIWLGQRLTPRTAPKPFERNTAAIAALKLTARECEILELLASGQSIKELARTLDVSLEKARALALIA